MQQALAPGSRHAAELQDHTSKAAASAALSSWHQPTGYPHSAWQLLWQPQQLLLVALLSLLLLLLLELLLVLVLLLLLLAARHCW